MLFKLKFRITYVFICIYFFISICFSIDISKKQEQDSKLDTTNIRVKIKASKRNSKIFINGKFVGDYKVKKYLSTGSYIIKETFCGSTLSEDTLFIPNNITKFKYRTLSRHVRFTMAYQMLFIEHPVDYSRYLANGITIGLISHDRFNPYLDFIVKSKTSNDDDKEFLALGGFANFNFDFNIADILRIGIGPSIGFMYESYFDDDYDNGLLTSNELSYKDITWGGPCFKIALGYKNGYIAFKYRQQLGMKRATKILYEDKTVGGWYSYPMDKHKLNEDVIEQFILKHVLGLEALFMF